MPPNGPDTRRKTLVKRCLRGRVPDAILDRRDKTVFGEHLLTHADYDVACAITSPTRRIGSPASTTGA